MFYDGRSSSSSSNVDGAVCLSLSLGLINEKTHSYNDHFFSHRSQFFFSYSSIWNTHEKTTTTTINYLGGENRFSSPIYQPTNKPPSHK